MTDDAAARNGVLMLRDPRLREDDPSMANPYRLGPMRRGINIVMTTMIRIGVGAPSSYLLTTTGRKTGSPRTTPVTLVEGDGDQWLVAPYGPVGWVHNVRSTPEVSLRRGRKTQVRKAIEVDADTAGPVLRRYVGDVQVTAPFFDAKASDPVERFVEEATRHPVFRLTEVG